MSSEDQKLVSLIADTGLQFVRFQLDLGSKLKKVKPIKFYEAFDKKVGKIVLDFAVQHPMDDDIWVSKRQAYIEGQLDEKGNLKEDANLNLLQTIDERFRFSIGNMNKVLDSLLDTWLPLPYFEQANFGSIETPINWSRVKIRRVVESTNPNLYDVVIVFDTNSKYVSQSNETPYFEGNSVSNTYSLCTNLESTFSFCQTDWIDSYLGRIQAKSKNRTEDSFPTQKHLANFIYLVHFLQENSLFPSVKLFKYDPENVVNVDFVLDIGNSRTCGLLIDTSDSQNPLSQVKMLTVTDLQDPFTTYTEPLSMRLAFHKPDFGQMNFNSDQFQWPSILRVGEEASRLVYLNTKIDRESRNKNSHHSSPKRFLWDSDPIKKQWEFVQLEGTNPISSIYLKGITDQFDSDGNLTSGSAGGSESKYSKKSLMTFVFLELLVHADSQINSYGFRTSHQKDERYPRKIKRLIVTCPTAMTKKEQIALRKCADDAASVYANFKINFYGHDEVEATKHKIKLIPSIKDLSRKEDEYENRVDWQYDEATCNQLVFLYAEICVRYLNKCDHFFQLYGSLRSDLPNPSQKSITIGSIDIGAGTTDLMISTYSYEESGKVVITPNPLFWESFDYAGDELVKRIIKKIIIEGQVSHDQEVGSIGVLRNYLAEKKVPDYINKLRNFFGVNSTKIEAFEQKMRQEFNVQIAIPIAYKYLELTRQNSEDIVLAFKDIFPLNKPRPSKKLLDYFESHFTVKFEDINWKFDKSIINGIVESVFEPLVKNITMILFAYKCDFVLLSGKPTTLDRLVDLFKKHYPVSPDRLISLNDYRIGDWYPFSDGSGYFNDHKSIVAVGASLALLGGKLDKLNNFKFNMDELKHKMNSTAHHLGKYGSYDKHISPILLSPDKNDASIKIDGFPFIIGSKRLNTEKYIGKMLYSLDINRDYIKSIIRSRKGIEDPLLLADACEDYIIKLKNKDPFEFTFEREYESDKEHIVISEIIDKEQNEVSKNLFKLQLKTMSSSIGYWMDTGIFELKIQEK